MFFNYEYERAVLSGLLLDQKIFDDYDFYEDLFHDKKNRQIFNEIGKCISEGIKPDIIVLTERLKDISPFYITGLSGAIPTISNIDFFRKELEELSKKRKINQVVKVIQSELKSKTAQELIEEIENALTDLNQSKSKGYKQLREYTGKALERLERKYHGTHDGIRIGFREPDWIIEEIPNGTLNIIAARTSQGKTAISLNIATNMIKQEKKIGYFSAEMSGDLISERFIQSFALVNTRKMREVKQSGFERIQDACNKIYDLPIWIDDTPNIYLYELKSKARKMRREGIDIIFVDYLGLIKYQNEKLSLYEKFGAISKELKQLARELNIPIIALHQLGREAESEKPRLDHLRNSGAIEEDADIVILMSGDRKKEPMEINFDVAKNRFGSASECKLLFKKEYQLITDIQYNS